MGNEFLYSELSSGFSPSKHPARSDFNTGDLCQQRSKPPVTYSDVVGVLVWIIGFLFEAVGDYQLRRFIGNPLNKGRIMMSGLWRFTRHPNYFGEVVLWWGIFLIALSVPGGWRTIVGPATITFLILKVSGIPMLEAKYRSNPQYEAYQRRTSSFVPLPPRL